MSTHISIRNFTLALATLLFFVFASASSAHAEGPGTKTVRGANDKLSAMLGSKATTPAAEKKLVEQARAKLGNFLDIEELGKRALKDHWATLSATQQAEFTQLLTDLIETNYVKGLRSNVKYKVEYLGESPKGKFLLVKTVIKAKRKGRPLTIEVDYLLRKSGKSLRTFDIMTDGVGLVENYRAMFNKIIAKSGFDALLGKMRKKLAAM